MITIITIIVIIIIIYPIIELMIPCTPAGGDPVSMSTAPQDAATSCPVLPASLGSHLQRDTPDVSSLLRADTIIRTKRNQTTHRS